MIYLVFFPLC